MLSLTITLQLLFLAAFAQDSVLNKYNQIKDQYITKVNSKVEAFNSDVDKYTVKALDRMIKQERIMQKKMAKTDSSKAVALFNYSIDSLKKFKSIIKSKTATITKYIKGDYFSYVDTLQQSLDFMNKAKKAGDIAGDFQHKLSSSLQSVNDLKGKLVSVAKIKEYVKQRQEVLKTQLDKFPQLTNNVKKFKKEAYYYQEQITGYKNMFKDPAKIESEVLKLVRKMPEFNKLMSENAQLSGLFAAPPSFPSSLPGATVPIVSGLASRADLQSFMKQNNPSMDVPKLMQQVHQKITETQNRTDSLGKLLNTPDKKEKSLIKHFAVNTQKTKAFIKRLEYSTDMQFGKSSGYLPANINLAAKIGYKLNDKSSVGVGAGYIVGLGTGWKHFKFTSEGLNLRTYLKWKLRKGLDIQGGSEWNYLLKTYDLSHLKNRDSWQQSALLGLSKNYSVGKKLKGNFQVLYDFLYKKHVPVTQPVVFRFGYGF